MDDSWHDFEIKLDSTTITFHVDNKALLASNELKHRTFGKIGFETKICLLHIDDISYFGNEGRLNNGVVQGEIRIVMDSAHMNSKGRPFWGLHLGVLQQSSKKLLGIVGFRDHQARNSADKLYPFCAIHSNNNGSNWEGTTVAERQWLVSVEGDSIHGIWPNPTRLNDGHILMGYNSLSGKNTAYFSDDKGKSWH